MHVRLDNVNYDLLSRIPINNKKVSAHILATSGYTFYANNKLEIVL